MDRCLHDIIGHHAHCVSQIHKITSEWQYLFDLAGVTRPMLEDPATLQFILDTVYQLGGAPTDMECVRQEALSSGESTIG